MWEEVIQAIESLKGEPLTYDVANTLIATPAVRNLFKRSPAATGVHNNWVGGLLEHVTSMLKIAEGVVEHYKKYRPELSREKVIFGVIFHDIGKIVEYDQENPSFDKTPLGFLTNHIVLGPAWIYEAANSYRVEDRHPNFKKERAHLMHLVASHHGCNEWGSPVPPATLEAIVLHHIDNLDSKFMHALSLIETAEKKSDSEQVSEYSRFEKVKFLVR